MTYFIDVLDLRDMTSTWPYGKNEKVLKWTDIPTFKSIKSAKKEILRIKKLYKEKYPDKNHRDINDWLLCKIVHYS